MSGSSSSEHLKPILLVEDDENGQAVTRRILEREGYQVRACSNGAEALECLRAESFLLLLTDIRMPQMDGLELVKAASLLAPQLPFIVMTAFGSVDQAVWVMKFGGVDFLSKPFKRSALLEAVGRAISRAPNPTQTPSAEGLQNSTGSLPNARFFFGKSERMQSLQSQMRKVAQSESTVLVVGESGAGKEGISRLLHDWSRRSAGPWVAVNCAALPANLIESELFGHEKGAFTGATHARVGLFELANHGTLLLDEIGELPLEAQAKLLRVLQEGELKRVGSVSPRTIDVRVIASTHRDLAQRVKEGSFREDLLYRLEVIRLDVPPLRERLEDLRGLCTVLLQESGKTLSESALKCLGAYSWPGNVRELANVLERASVFSANSEIQVLDLPVHLQALLTDEGQTSDLPSSLREERSNGTIEVKLGTPLREVEELLIQRTLEMTDGDKNMTARLLGINSRTIYRKLSSNP